MKYSNNTFYLKNSIGSYFILNFIVYFILLTIFTFLKINYFIADCIFFATSSILIFFSINTIEIKKEELKELSSEKYSNEDFDIVSKKLFYSIEILNLNKLNYNIIYILRINNFINKNSLKVDSTIFFVIYFIWTSKFSQITNIYIYFLITILYFQFSYTIFNYLYKSFKEKKYEGIDQGKTLFLIITFFIITYHQSIATRYYFGIEKINHPFEKFNYEAEYEVEFRFKNDNQIHKGIATINVNDTYGYDYIYLENGDDLYFNGEEHFNFTHFKEKLTNIKKLVSNGKTWEFDLYADDIGEYPNYLIYKEFSWCKAKNGSIFYIKLTDIKVK